MGAGEAFICAGVESMTRVPMMGFNPMPNPQLAKDMPDAYVSMGITARKSGAQIPDYQDGPAGNGGAKPCQGARRRKQRENLMRKSCRLP